MVENSYGALEKYKRQFSEQVQGLRKQMEKTTLIVDGMEVLFVKLFQQFIFFFRIKASHNVAVFMEMNSSLL